MIYLITLAKQSKRITTVFSSSQMEVFKAAADGDLKKVQKMIRDTGPALREDQTGFTLLHAASANSQPDVVLFLLKLIDPNITNNQGQTPAHVAAIRGHTQVLRILLSDEEINHEKKDNFRMTYKDLVIIKLLC